MTTPEPGRFGPPAPLPADAYGAPLPPPSGQFGAPVPPPSGQFGAPVPPPADAFGAPIPQQPAPYGYAPMPAAPEKPGNVGAGIAVGFGVMIACALLYGFLMKSTNSQWSYFALALAAAVAFGLGKVGGRHPVLPLLGLLFSVLGVFLGQLFYIYLAAHQEYGASFGDVFGTDFSVTIDIWKNLMNFKDILFYAIAAAEGFIITKRVGASS